MRRSMCTALIIAVLAVCTAHAVTYDFEVFTDNGEHYSELDGLYVDVTNGDGYVDFTFYNDSSVQSSVTGIYFDDGTLFDIDSITNGPGTDFTYPQTPGNLPGGGQLVPPFEASRQFNAGAVNPVPMKGINEGDTLNEWVTINFTLRGSGTLDDVIAELNSGVLRIGLHIIAIGGDSSSESAILVPEPATMGLLGLGGLLLMRRRRRH